MWDSTLIGFAKRHMMFLGSFFALNVIAGLMRTHGPAELAGTCNDIWPWNENACLKPRLTDIYFLSFHTSGWNGFGWYVAVIAPMIATAVLVVFIVYDVIVLPLFVAIEALFTVKPVYICTKLDCSCVEREPEVFNQNTGK